MQPPSANPLAGNPLTDRADVARAVRDLVRPLEPYVSRSGARVRLGATAAHFDRAAAELEGFARLLWGLAPLAAGGSEVGVWERYRRGLAAGTDPEHPDYWGDVGDCDQRQVELAAIGFALRLARGTLWDPLDAPARRRIAAYLTAARGRDFVDNNWKFFRVLIDLGLEHCGIAVDPAGRRACLDEIDGFHLGDGWYRDGSVRQADHYIPFAFHFYGLVYAALADDAERAAAYRDRARRFARDVRHWYADDGAALPFGRSLTYRFAHAGFWGALAFAGVEALPWGEIKGYYLRQLRWWAGRPIADRDGVLSVGFAYPNLRMAEDYNSPGSPYWAMKAFLPLALPGDHPFWQAEEAPPPEPDPRPVPLPAPGMVAMHLPGHVVVLSSGQEQRRWHGGAEKYAKFAYSTRYGFSVEADDRRFAAAALDSMLGFSDDGMHVRMRETNVEVAIAGERLFARWRPYRDVEVETWLVPAAPWHLRIHRVTSAGSLEVCEGGFAIARPDFGAWHEDFAPRSGSVRTASDISAIVGFDSRTPRIHSPPPNTNVMAPRTLVPQLRGRIAAGVTVLAAAVLALPAEEGAGVASNDPPAPPDVDALEAAFAEAGRPVAVFQV